jgi:hypothetical protein
VRWHYSQNKIVSKKGGQGKKSWHYLYKDRGQEDKWTLHSSGSCRWDCFSHCWIPRAWPSVWQSRHTAELPNSMRVNPSVPSICYIIDVN